MSQGGGAQKKVSRIIWMAPNVILWRFNVVYQTILTVIKKWH